MSRFKRLVTLILVVLFLNTSIPTEVLAETLNGENKATQADPQVKEKESKKEALILQEIKEKRTSNTKYFLKDDHSYEVAIYPNDIHYYEDGQWKDIDNSLEEATDIEKDVSGKEVKQQTSGNKGNDFKVKVAKYSDSKKLVKVAKGKYEIFWGFNDIGKVKGENKILENSNVEGLLENDKKQLVKNNSSQINFSNVYKNIDLQYNIIGRKLKENFIIKEKTEIPQIQFQIEMKNLTYKINENNTITFLDEVTKEKVFEIEPPIMHDAAGEVSTNIKFTSVEDKKEKVNLKSNDLATDSQVVEENNKGEGSSNPTNVTNENSTSEGNKEAAVPNKGEETLQKSQESKEDSVSNKAAEQNVIEQSKDSASNTNIDNNSINAEKEISKPGNENISNSNNNSVNGNNLKENKEAEKKPEDNSKDKGNNKNVLNLTMELDRQWINSSERVFPITVDPTVGTSLDTKKIYDTFIFEKNPSANRWNTEFLATGNGSASGINRSLIKFDLPALTSSDMVVEAKLNLALWEPDTNVTQVNAYKINSSWDPLNTTWSNQPIVDSAAEDYAMVTGSSGTWYGWDITRVVKDWYNTGVNNGIMLKNQNEGETYNVFVSSDSAPVYIEARPRILISYISNSGLENYWTYHSQSAGRAGTSYVNDYNGNLVHIHDDIAMTGSRNPITIQHVYNSNNLGYDPKRPWMGRGWNLSIYQWLVKETIGGNPYYKYTDGDGTNQYFKDTGATELKDELNLGYTLTTDSSGYRYITDKNNNKIKFYADGSLLSFIDRNGNETMTTWTKYNEVWCITALTDAAGRSVKLDYVSNGYLTSITDASGLKTQFALNNGDNNLYQITYPDGNFSKFDYYYDYSLYGATNIDGYSLWYEYTDNKPFRVDKMYEWNQGVYGKEIRMAYGNNTTTFTDVQGRKETYQFDINGQTISIKDAEDKAQYYEYNNDTNKRKLGQSSKLQSTVINYLQDHDAELEKEWWPNSDASTYTTEEKYLGNKSLKVSSTVEKPELYFAESLKLSKGKTYTFSGYVKTKDVTNKPNAGAALTIGYQDKSGAYKYEKVFINGTTDWARYEKSITVPSDAYNDYIWVGAELINATGTAYFDSLQLEEGPFANRYNLVENPEFTLWDNNTWKPLYWTMNYGIDSTDFVDYSQGTHPKGMNTLTMKMNGNARANKGIFQNVNIAGKKGDVYVLGGWARANSVPVRDGRLFQMDLGFIKQDGSTVWKTVSFNDDVSDWQYASKEIVAPEDYKSLQVYISYYKNIGIANFDGIQLYKEEFGTSYQYDSKGNVVSTADLAKQNSNFEYSTNNDLTKSIDPKGNSFSYEYDNGNAALKNHNLTKATSAENVVYSFQYDNGNPIKATVGSVGVGALFIQSDATYSTNKNYIKTVIDASGNTVTFNYDETKGTLNSVVDSNSKTTNYSYDPKTNNLTSVNKIADNATVTNSYGYDKDKIKTITHNGFNYQFNYDLMGNNTEVLVGSQRLILNYFKERNGLLDKSVYGNGQSVSYTYDNVDRVTGKKYDTDTANRYTYGYDAEGNLAQKNDNSNNTSYRYNYDISGKLMNINESNGDITRFAYDKNNNTNALMEKVKGKNYNTSYGYDKDNRLKKITYSRSTLATSLSEKLIAEYNFNNKDASDTSGRGYDGIIHGTPTFENTKRGQGIKLNGVDQWVELPEFTPSSSYTVSAFLQPEEVKTMSFLNKVNETGLVNKLWFGVMGSGYSVQINTPEYIVGTATATYQHIVATIEKTSASTSKVIIYKDGTPLGSTTLNSTADDMGGKGWSLGQDIDGTSLTDFFKGIIDEVSIYNGVLSQDEIKSISEDNYYVNKTYDSIGRLTTSTINNNITTSYQYETGKTISTPAGNAVSSTNRISSIKNNKNIMTYTYDKAGNIETITEDGKTIKYYYNELNELIREDNAVLDRTIVYSYDIGGNIKSKTEYPYTTVAPISATTTATATINYGYDTAWKDKLTSYNGKTIIYDNIGNPLTYEGYNFTWEGGRQLNGITGNGKTMSYKYNDSGIRTEKTVDGVTTTYHLVGDKVTFESNGTDNVYYTYDSAGKLVSMNISIKISETSWSTPTEYFYVRNGQNDIIGLIDKAGTQVASYNYDSWGKMTPSKAEIDDANDTNKDGITGTLKDTVGVKNPYRYKGYRYDPETELYYLQSRYYNPTWGRFINADGITGAHGELLSHNMFAYCANEPINRHDPSGFIWDFMDIGMAALSWADFAKKPSMGGLALAVIDTVACAPVVPSTGYFRRGAQVAGKVSDGIKGAGKAGAGNIANGAKLKEFYKQAEKYGTGLIKELENGKFRFYGEIKAAAKEGEMAGARLVREWDPASGAKRIWYETVDHAGNIRQVRPDPSVTGGVKTHYMFDINGNYTGSWVPKK